MLFCVDVNMTRFLQSQSTYLDCMTSLSSSFFVFTQKVQTEIAQFESNKKKLATYAFASSSK